MTIPYIADAAQLQGFREGATQVWVPIEFPFDDSADVVNVYYDHSRRRWVAECGEDEYRDILRHDSTITCPYKVGDVLVVKEPWHAKSLSLNPDRWTGKWDKDTVQYLEECQRVTPVITRALTWLSAESMPDDFARFHLPIAKVEAKTLGEMTAEDALSMGLAHPKETIGMVSAYVIDWWNARHPDHPWDEDRWCWKLEVKSEQ